VSFDRPYEYERPATESHPEVEFGAGHLFLAELWMLRWLEMKGYDISYVTNLDVDADPHALDGRRLFLDVGHDEYWTEGERDAVDAARDAGVSLGFFSANDAYWRVRLDASSSGTSRRIVTCYKGASADPEGTTSTATIRFRDRPHDHPEDSLIGQMYELWTNLDGFPLVVGDASHWIYEGTGVAAGDTLPHIVGYELDHVFNDGTSPPVEIAATSSAFSQLGAMSVSNVTVYYPSASSFVFSAGTIEWAWALGKPGFEDDRVKRITENVLSRAGFAPNRPTVVAPSPRPLDVGRVRVAVLAGSGAAGSADGKGAEATFDYPAGVTASGDLVYVSDHDNSAIRRIASDGTVTTIAGCGRRKFADGAGTSACFDLPTGLVAGADGTLYVADTSNHRIRAIDVRGNVTTFAGSGSDVTQDAADPLQAGIAYPRGIALGPDGALYLASDQTSIRRVGSDGVKTIATADGEVSGVAVGNDGVVYVVETWAGRVSAVRDGKLVPLVNPLGEFGDVGGPGDTAMMRPAEGIGVDGNRLVVTDSANYKVRSIALDGDHRVTTVLGDGCAARRDDDGVSARVINPRGVAVLPGGDYVVADTGNHRILRVDMASHPSH
jgi:sugar lactone lactonase YvrE